MRLLHLALLASPASAFLAGGHAARPRPPLLARAGAQRSAHAALLSIVPEQDGTDEPGQGGMQQVVMPVTALLTLLSSAPAEAAGADAVPSALAAYGHYLSLILIVLALATERLLIKPDMSEDEFDKVAAADAAYGVAGVLLLVTGYFRVTQYGKGWDFYQHEPIFWLKLTLVSVMGASSFFPTIKIVQRAIAKRGGGEQPPPLSPKLVERLVSVINAELLAVLTIPLAATFMARGVGYAEWLPWWGGAAPVALALGGLGYKYVKEALEWQD